MFTLSSTCWNRGREVVTVGLTNWVLGVVVGIAVSTLDCAALGAVLKGSVGVEVVRAVGLTEGTVRVGTLVVGFAVGTRVVGEAEGRAEGRDVGSDVGRGVG